MVCRAHQAARNIGLLEQSCGYEARTWLIMLGRNKENA